MRLGDNSRSRLNWVASLHRSTFASAKGGGEQIGPTRLLTVPQYYDEIARDMAAHEALDATSTLPPTSLDVVSQP
jgi:hypothetical protein